MVGLSHVDTFLLKQNRIVRQQVDNTHSILIFFHTKLFKIIEMLLLHNNTKLFSYEDSTT